MMGRRLYRGFCFGRFGGLRGRLELEILRAGRKLVMTPVGCEVQIGISRASEVQGVQEERQGD